ncbi:MULTISPECIES: hypothetical protein [Burkholderia]|uniref:hypothetical protein n=1 Tax=Burkholderia TaxID=32008 RepID=UPI00048639E3|nr:MULTISPECIES: hypothetical protein [Burkholderia]
MKGAPEGVQMAEKVNFWVDDGNSPVIDCEEFIAAFVRAKYRDGSNLAPEENDGIREATAEVLRESIGSAVQSGTLEPRGRDMLPLRFGIPQRAQFEPFNGLYFERESFLAFAKEAWLVSKADNSPPTANPPQSAQAITVEDLAWMIAVQRADQTTTHAHGLDARDGLHRTIEIALQVRGRTPEGIPGVIPQIAEMVRCKQITLHGPDGIEVPDAADISACPAAWWLTAEDAQQVLTALCQSVRRYTVDDAADIIAMRVHPQDVEAQRALQSSLVERMEYAIEQGELLANERRKDGEILLNEYTVDEWCAREQFPFRLGLIAQVDVEQAAMEAAGRRTIEDVALALAKETGTEAARWESTLVAEIRGGALPLKNPRDLGDFLPYAVPKNLRTFYDRVDIADVNRLLDSRPEWRVTYQFRTDAAAAPASAVEVEAAPARPPLQQRHQENEILRVIRELGEDPARLPKQTPGKPGIKAAVRAKLAFSGKVFDLAWERLRKNGEIADAQ